MEFHEKYKHWTHDPSPIQHPISLQTSTADWVQIGAIDNPSPGQPAQEFELKTAIKRSMTGTIENEVSLDVEGIATFSVTIQA